MRTGAAQAAALLLVLAITILQVSAAADIYWEGEEDASNEFLEVKHDDPSLLDHLKRIKRDWSFFDPFNLGSSTKAEENEATESVDKESDTYYGKQDDNFGSGSIISPESETKEKTLRVTFTVQEPYRTEYSNRDSPEFLEFSHSLANAVDALFEKLPGTQKSSLVRIQSLVLDNFSCKVTLDIVTTDYEDTKTIEDLLRNHIKNNGRLGRTTVTVNGFNAQLIDPASEPDIADTEPVEVTTEYQYSPINYTSYTPEENFDNQGNLEVGNYNPETNSYDQKSDDPDRSSQDPNQSSPDQDPYQNRPDEDPYQTRPDQDPNQSSPDQDPYQNRPDEDPYQTRPEQDPNQNSVDQDPYQNRPDQDPNQNSVNQDPYETRTDQDPNQNSVDQDPYQTRTDQDPYQGQPDQDPYGNRPDEDPYQNRPDEDPYQSRPEQDPYGDNRVDSEPRRGDGGRLGTDGPEDPLVTGDGSNAPGSSQTESSPVITTSRNGESDCPYGHLRCDLTRCIESSRRCDGVKDCYDESDEAGCPDVTCGRDDFKCNDGKCIEASRQCDNVYDCAGQEDERDCDCLPGEFRCENDGLCIEERKRCDGIPHCSDRSDESNCQVSRLITWAGHHACRDTGRFRCSDGTCISILLRCDGFKDCRTDGNDEIGCPCGADQWQCDHGSCIKRKFRCDGRVDCPTDRSDERNCIASGSFRCKTGQFIPEYLRCNRRYDCPPGDFSDEQNCPCGASDFKCDNGHCIPASKRCDRTHDCQDRSDERHCTYGTLCMAYEYECKSGMCVPAEARCNGTVECDDDTDEINCSCKRDQYPCRDGSCINIAFLCNGHEDCSNGEDEYNCRSFGNIRWKCEDGVYIRAENRCDGRYDCQDHSDEKNCKASCPTKEATCPSNEFTCPGGSTLCAVACNGREECEGGEDEIDCPSPGVCELRCDEDHKCIQAQNICDRNPDCDDGADENDCDYCDTPADFSCGSNQCIPATLRCNGIPDCEDSSDELNCNSTMNSNTPCKDDEFTCQSDQACINLHFQCDGHPDCTDESDESNCPCPMADSMQCRNGECIPTAAYCNGIQDCSDGSDEVDCQYTTQRTYLLSTTNRLPTDNSRYPDGSSSNGYPSYNPRDPYDPYGQAGPRGSDRGPGSRGPDRGPYGGAESGSPDRGQNGGSGGSGPDRGPYGGAGAGGSDRGPYGGPGSGSPDRGQYGGAGAGGSDRGPYGGVGSGSPDRGEYGGAGAGGSDRGPYGGAGAGGPDRGQYGGAGAGGSDRGPYGGAGAGGSDRGPYGGAGAGGSDRGPYGGAGAGGSDRGPYGGAGAGGSDRGPYGGAGAGGSGRGPYGGAGAGGSDRGPYGGAGTGGSDRGPYGGAGSGSYGGAGRGSPDSGSYGGAGSGGCRAHEWRCENGPCIDAYRRCDGHIDCPFDYSDEFDCPPNSPVTLNLKTYPSAQSIRHGGDVVFQCRDEGPKRARVRWYREGGSLKGGSTDIKGRLEMFKVTTADSGVYICRADEYNGYPGSEVRVTLEVESAPVTYRPFMACQPYEATCGNGQCIPKSAVCNNKVDCSDGSDEENCHHGGMCEPNEFKCDNRKCILKTWICDSENDCGDGSDERDCGPKIEGQCLPVEYTCKSGDQCIPKSFHCDEQTDCLDGSDEIGCIPVYMKTPPTPANVKLNPGETLILRAEAAGNPMPLISWRLNWGHVPAKCTSTSENGVGILTCPNMQPEDSGAYSAEAINYKGTSFLAPDAIVFVSKTDICPSGYFNSEARSESECIRCFCFRKSTQCRSADLFTYNMPTPLGEGGTRLIGIKASRTNEVVIDTQPISSTYFYQPLRNGATVTKSSDYSSWPNAHPYLTLPEMYNGNQLKSYGGHIKYILSPQTQIYEFDSSAATIIIKGKYGNLFHINRSGGTQDINVEARLTPEDWSKYPDGSAPVSREDIMMVLYDIEMILLRADMNNAGVNITDFAMESAEHFNVGMGAASLVEECTCPKGYEGLSCQKCASGYVRNKVGPWLGNCEREECPPGTYGDPSSGLPCTPCPCPLTNKQNQFARTCSLGPDGNVICDCFPGYTGLNCEACAEGYEGNPLLVGNTCQPKKRDNCDPIGTRSIRPPDECVCKDNVEGRYCNQCKKNAFYLSKDSSHGCALCFCTGVSQQCRSTTSRRKTTSVQFSVPQIVEQVKIYNSAPVGVTGSGRYSAPKETQLRPQLQRGELTLTVDPNAGNSVYYWSMPASFAGDKVTSYGGFLRYTLKNVASADPRYRNTAPDVQLISDNQLTFQYFGDYSASHDRILNASVQFLEKGWQRQDGKEVTREFFLLALADVKTILIKANYGPGSQIASPVSASIETAEPDAYGPTAYHVEECVCPAGYVGTSCEDCAPGYTRDESGLYLQFCSPCECNGKSKMCHPETGVCFDCEDNTEGPKCENCKPGYERDPYGNCVELRSSTDRSCSCDPRGTSAPCDSSGNCVCKQNVEGDSCDRCRPGTFGLDTSNPAGCLSCFCSGVTQDCHEGTHYARMAIAAPVLGDDYGGFTITDLKAERVIKDNFAPIFEQSELMYNIQFQPDVELYWSLPVLPGNRVLSYGGSINLRQKFSSESDLQSERGTDVVLDGGDNSIYWTNPNQFSSGISYNYQVPLKEDGWFTLNSVTPVTRSDFMNVLRNLKRVLVRATVARGIYETTIADVSIDTAIQNYEADLPVAKGIEICMCPPGYVGTSCESCKNGFYKDQLGYCRECPCNDHNCQLDSSGQVVCNCQPPYTGYDCSTIGLIMELHPTIHEAAGNDMNLRRVTFTCKYRAPEPLTIKFYHEGLEQQPPKYFNESRLEKDGWHGEHVWHTVWDTRYEGEIYECHTFTEKGFTLGVLTTSLPEPGGDSSVTEPPTRPTPSEPTVSVTIISPTIKIQEVGSSVNFTCQAQSRNTRSRLPIRWSKRDGALPLGRSYVDDSYGVLQITNLQVTDSGVYICETSDGINTAQATVSLRVPGNELKQPSVEISPSVKEYYEGDRIELECRVRGNPTPTIRWLRGSNRPLPLSAENQGYWFIIDNARVEDAGEYRCVATNTVGTDRGTAMITIRPRPSEPTRETLIVSNTSPSVEEGNSIRIVCTGTTDIPAGAIDWVRQDNTDFPSNVRSENGVLYIEYAVPSNQGVYICRSQLSSVAPIPILVSVIEVNPVPEVVNISVSVERLTIPTGGSGTVDCNVVGRPLPLIKWSKHDGAFGPQSSQRGNTLIINNAQDSDRGYYVCDGIINGNSVAKSYVFVEIERREPPRVEIWPQGEQSVQLYGQHELHCRVLGGIPEPDVTWNRNGGRPLSSSTQIQPHNVLKFQRIEVNDEGEYTCTARNDAGSVSASAVIKVRAAPEITITPNGYISAHDGEPFQVECRASGYPEPMVSISLNDRELVPAQPGHATLHVSSASSRDSGYYTCTATSVAGTITEQFVVDVENRGDIYEPEPHIPDTDEGSGEGYYTDFPDGQDNYNTLPSNFYAIEGQPETSISCNETGNVRWVRADNMPFSRNVFQSGTRLVFRNVSKKDSAQYVCTIYDEYGESRQAVFINVVVVSAPNITLVPPSQTVQPGQSPTVECVVSGDDVIDILWRPYDREAPSRMEIRNNMLIFNNIEVEDAGKYECIARSQYANRSSIAEVIVREDSDRTWVSHDNEQWAHSGAAVHLSCNKTQPNTLIDWTKDGRPLPRSVTRKSDGSLFLRLAHKSDSGRYVCSVRDAYGRVLTSNYIDLHIQGYECLKTEFRCYDNSSCVDERLLCDGRRDCQDNSDEENCLWRDKRFSDTLKESLAHDGPRDSESQQLIYLEKPSGNVFRVGDNVNVVCKIRSRDVKVQWSRPGTSEYVDSTTYGDGAMLQIQSVTNADAGVYRCIGTDSQGRRSIEDFDLRVAPSSGGQTYPDYSDGSDMHVAEYSAQLGDGVEMPCLHNLEPPVTIEWRREFLPLPASVRPNQPILYFDSVSETDAGTYVCRVSNRRTSVETTAILTVKGVIPRFDGSSYIALPPPKDVYLQLEFEISFKPTDSNGLILYNSQNQGRTGDFIALQLQDGIPEFLMKTNADAVVKVKYDRPIQLNVWHTIRIRKTQTKVTMDVDNKGPFDSDTREWDVLDLDQPLYIGGVPDYNQLPVELAGASGMIGCVSMLILGSEEKNLMVDSREQHAIQKCNSCLPNLCQNNGFCQEYRNERGYVCNCAPGFAGLNCDRTGEACRPSICGPGKCSDTETGYKCACPVTHTGKNCEFKQSIEYPAFSGSSYVAIKSPRPSRILKMSMNIKAASPPTDGIIMYCAESQIGYGGFTSLAVHNGKLEFRYHLGGGGQPVVLVSNRTLPTNEWTNVDIARIGAVVSLKINSVQSYEQKLPEPYSKLALTLKTPIFLGGVDESYTLNNNTGVTEGFYGCIKDIKLHGLPVNIINQTIQSANVHECVSSADNRGDIPEGENLICQCHNGGQCISASEPTVCSCPPGFTGQLCDLRAPLSLTNPCDLQPCKNGGTCRPVQSARIMNHTCDCKLGYAGMNCQIDLTLPQSVAFNGNGYIELPAHLLPYENLQGKPATIAMSFYTNSDGVLLFQNEARVPPNYGDSLLLRIERGFIVFEWNLGSGKDSVTENRVYVSNGERHQVVVMLYPDGNVELAVDLYRNTGTKSGIAGDMNADSNIYIGGIPETLNLDAYPGFVGCIAQIELMDSSALNLGEVAVAGRNTQRCKDAQLYRDY